MEIEIKTTSKTEKCAERDREETQNKTKIPTVKKRTP